MLENLSHPPLRIAIVAPPWFPIPPGGYGGIESMVHTLVEGLASPRWSRPTARSPQMAIRYRVLSRYAGLVAISDGQRAKGPDLAWEGPREALSRGAGAVAARPDAEWFGVADTDYRPMLAQAGSGGPA